MSVGSVCLCVRACQVRAFVCVLVHVCLCQCLRARASAREWAHPLSFRPSQASLPISALGSVSASTPVLRLGL